VTPLQVHTITSAETRRLKTEIFVTISTSSQTRFHGSQMSKSVCFVAKLLKKKAQGKEQKNAEGKVPEQSGIVDLSVLGFRPFPAHKEGGNISKTVETFEFGLAAAHFASILQQVLSFISY
jgi:hypothetical protein